MIVHIVHFRSLPPPSLHDTYPIYKHESTSSSRYKKRKLMRSENEQVVNEFDTFSSQPVEDASDTANSQYIPFELDQRPAYSFFTMKKKRYLVAIYDPEELTLLLQPVKVLPVRQTVKAIREGYFDPLERKVTIVLIH